MEYLVAYCSTSPTPIYTPGFSKMVFCQGKVQGKRSALEQASIQFQA